jgi:Siphovirus Gp157
MPSNVPHGAQIERAMSAAMEAISALPDDGDNVLLLNTIEGESDVLEVLDRVVEAAIADKKLAELARERAKRIEARADRARSVALQIIEALQVSPLERPLYSASISYPRKPLVTNADELPKEMIREAPDMVAIGKALRAGETIPGAELKNPEPQLTIRVS